MDLHIYDMKLDPENIVVLTGSISKEDMIGFAGYVQIIHNICKNPVIYVPDELTLDQLSYEETASLLKDAMDIDALERLCAIVNDAFMQKSSEVIKEAKADEV